MELYIAIRGKTRGKIYDLTEDGLEEMTFREENGKRIPTGYTGFILPYTAMKDDVIRLARKGQPVDPKIYEHFKH